MSAATSALREYSWDSYDQTASATGFIGYVAQKKYRPQVRPDPSDNAAVFPGKLANADTIRYEKKREELITLVKQLSSDPFSWNSNAHCVVDGDTAIAATRFLSRIPTPWKLPRLAPNGEGGLIMIWDHDASQAIVVVTEWKLHLVSNPGTSAAAYIDDEPFDGETIPTEFISVLSKI
jgi:hypothetical protein